MTPPPTVSRREREVLDILFRLRRATVAEVLAEMEDPPSYSAARSTLSILEQKGHVTHGHEGNRYVYRPAEDPQAARRSALDHLLSTFFEGSTAEVVSALLEQRGRELSAAELDRLSRLIRQARKEGR